jgi:AcrR family transcriptional regulator
MAHKKPQSSENSTKIRNKILSAGLDVAASHQWEFVAISQIADAAGLTVDEVMARFQTKSDIVAAIIDALDTEVEEGFSVVDEDVPIRDRLFDVLMERIEIANQNRAAHISFFKSFGWTKESSCADIALLKSSMTRMAKCAGMDTEGLFGGIHLGGLSLAYLWVLLTWVNDASPDLGKTMAELDRTLGRAESLMNYFKS